MKLYIRILTDFLNNGYTLEHVIITNKLPSGDFCVKSMETDNRYIASPNMLVLA